MKKTIRARSKKAITDYGRRLKLLKSGKPRVVFRKTNKYVIAQYVTSSEAQDKVEINVTSKELLKFGWDAKAVGGLKSITASYLTGYLIAKKITKGKLETPIVDLGMLRTDHKTKVFAFLKGLIDAGLEIPCSEKAFPEAERIAGSNLKTKVDVEKIKSELEKI